MTNKVGIKIENHGCGYPRNPSAPRFQFEPKLTLTTRITGTWGVDVRFFDAFPKKGFGRDSD
jgi:hypothetical protein